MINRIVPILLLIALALNITLHALPQLNSLPILTDGPHMDAIGYDNCDMKTNGELEMFKLIAKGNIIFDIGANKGEWSAYCLSLNGGVKLFVFEPIPLIFHKLTQNLSSYKANLFNLALSDENGTASFTYYPSISELSTFHKREVLEKASGLKGYEIKVKMQRLDTFCTENHIEHIDYAKIDTEGHEWFVLQGAREMLSNGKISFVQFEYGGCFIDSNTTLKQIYDELTGYGYMIFRITPNGLIHISEWRDALENYRYSNYLAVFIQI